MLAYTIIRNKRAAAKELKLQAEGPKAEQPKEEKPEKKEKAVFSKKDKAEKKAAKTEEAAEKEVPGQKTEVMAGVTPQLRPFRLRKWLHRLMRTTILSIWRLPMFPIRKEDLLRKARKSILSEENPRWICAFPTMVMYPVRTVNSKSKTAFCILRT